MISHWIMNLKYIKIYNTMINQIFVPIVFQKKRNVDLFDNLVVNGIIFCQSQFWNDKKKNELKGYANS